MDKNSSPKESEEGVTAVRLDQLRQLFSWLQEHTNLCTVALRVGQGGSPDGKLLEETLKGSLERGQKLVEGILEGHAAPQLLSAQHVVDGILASSGGLGNKVSKTVLPLSGKRRFEDAPQGMSLAQAAADKATSDRISASSLLDRTQPQKAASLTASTANPKFCLLPSRTYLKKSEN